MTAIEARVICNHQVGGSNPFTGSIKIKKWRVYLLATFLIFRYKVSYRVK